MASPLFALFIRSLCQDSYGKATYWTRAGLCALMLFVLSVIAQETILSGAPGLYFFIGIVSLQMVGISLIGLSYFGSAIAEEKEEQTLGLLRMTDLSPVSILLGKSTSRLCGALLLLAAAFPFTVFSVTLGGVSLGQIIATYCTIAAYTFLLCNVALLGSVLARNTTGAATFSAAVIAVLLGVAPLLNELDGRLQKFGITSGLGYIVDFLWRATPIARLTEILTTGFSSPPIGWQVECNLALGAGSFFLAWAAFGRFCERASEESGGGSGKFMRVLGMRIRRPPRPANHPIAWKEYYFLCGGNPGLILRVVCYLVGPVIIFGILVFNTDPDLGSTISFFDTWITVVFYLDTGFMAATVFRNELNGQTLSALAILPGTVRGIAYRKARVLFLIFIPGMVATTGAGLLQSWFYAYQSGYAAFHGSLLVQSASPVIMAVLFVHLVIWFSLVLKRGALPIGIVALLTLTGVVSIAGSSLIQTVYRSFGNSPVFAWAMFNFILSSSVNIALTILLHFRSLRRLEALAAES